MATSDYRLCDNCYAKTYYDAEVDYETPNVGQVAALCTSCWNKGFRLSVTKKGVA